MEIQTSAFQSSKPFTQLCLVFMLVITRICCETEAGTWKEETLDPTFTTQPGNCMTNCDKDSDNKYTVHGQYVQQVFNTRYAQEQDS